MVSLAANNMRCTTRVLCISKSPLMSRNLEIRQHRSASFTEPSQSHHHHYARPPSTPLHPYRLAPLQSRHHYYTRPPPLPPSLSSYSQKTHIPITSQCSRASSVPALASYVIA